MRPSNSHRRYVLLDRDGTLIVEREYLAAPERVELLPNSARGLRRLQELEFGLIVVTNQSGIARGLFTEADLSAIHRRLNQLLAAEGVKLDGYYVCPHSPEDRCSCRKPATGLAQQAAREHGFSLPDSVVIGDKPCDLQLGQTIGAQTVLVRTGYGAETERSDFCTPTLIANDLLDAAQQIEISLLALTTIHPAQGISPMTLITDTRIDTIRNHLLSSVLVKQRTIEACGDAILAAADLIAESFRAGGKLLICGNGGSAADCQHLAAEFTSRLSSDFERPGLPALALTTDSSFLTAYANDYSFDGIFARQVQALGKAGDVLLGISTSGNSANVVAAVSAAREEGLRTIVLTGERGRLRELADVAICIPSENTQHIQEAHLAVEHLLCHLVERALFPNRG